MDFLDPKKRRNYQIRLLFGYFLVSITIIFATLILVYAAYGYGINTKTGQLIENGLVFVDSKPAKAKIALNGKDQNANTSTKLVLPAGKYALTLTKAGYRGWTHNFNLDEHSVLRFSYPMLLPIDPAVTVVKSYQEKPSFVSQSIDKRWVVIGGANSSSSPSIDLLDTNDLTKEPIAISLPNNLFSLTGGKAKVLEWATDNNHFLLENDLGNDKEFLLLSKDKPSESININSLFKTSPASVSLFNKTSEQVILYNDKDKSLKLGSVASGQISTSFSIANVQAYNTLDSSTVVYVSSSINATNEYDVKVWNDNKSYKLTSVKPSSAYLLDGDEYQGHHYISVTSVSDSTTHLYIDPLSQLKSSESSIVVPIASLTMPTATFAHFSATGRNFIVTNGQDFMSYDIENKVKDKYALTQSMTDQAWLDGYRLVGNRADKLLILDFDGTNQIELTASILNKGGFISKDSKHMITLTNNTGAFQLNNIDLRAGVDLPKP